MRSGGFFSAAAMRNALVLGVSIVSVRLAGEPGAAVVAASLPSSTQTCTHSNLSQNSPGNHQEREIACAVTPQAGSSAERKKSTMPEDMS